MSFKPSMDQQRSCPTCTDSLLNGDFIITYDVNRESPANVQVPAPEPRWAGWSSVARMRWWLVQEGLQQQLVPRPSVLSPRPSVLHGLGMPDHPEPLYGTPRWMGQARCFLELVNVWLCFCSGVAKGTWPTLSLSPSQIVNGYFVHFFAPQGLPVVPKSVVFVIDVSGSMHGRKMEQVFPSRQGGEADKRR